jgi:hypothetical protein
VRPAVHALRTELTSRSGLVVGLLSVAVALITALTRMPPPTGPSWSAAFNEALIGVVALAPVCAGAVAWLVQDYQRRGIAALAASSPRGAAGGALPRVGVALGWALLGYLLLLVISAVRTTHRGLPGWPPLLLVLLATAFLTTGAALGWAVGAAVNLPAAPPLLAVALFAGIYAGSYGDDWAGRLVPVDRMSVYRSFLQPNVRLVLAQVAVLAGIGALALCVPLAGGLARRWTGLSAAVVLTGAVLVLSKTDPDPTEIRAAPRQPACAGGPIVLCLRPENADLLGASSAALSAAAAALAPYLTVPERFSEPGIDRRVEQGPGVYVPPAQAGDPLAFEAAALTAILPPPCPRRVADASATTAYRDVLIWANARVNGLAGIPAYQRARFERILGNTVPGQREWVQKHLTAACS